MMGFQIAIDGPAGAGKSTIAKEVAKRLGFIYIDTGAMYRAVTLKALNLKIDLHFEENYNFLNSTSLHFNAEDNHLILDGKDVEEDIRSNIVADNVSVPSMISCVRTTLVDWQRQLASDNNVIMDGRDIGTVVLPNADLKIYLNASVECRAQRRLDENLSKGLNDLDYEGTIESIKQRDFKDSNREISPLKKADDAIEIDSSDLCIEDVVRQIISLVLKRGYKMENELLNANATTEEVVEETQASEEANEVAASTPAYKPYQVVEGKVAHVLDASEARGKVKAKDQRVVVELPDGSTGMLLKKDIAGLEEGEDLFDRYVEGDAIVVAVKKVYEDGGILLSTELLQVRDELKKFEEVIKEHGTFEASVEKVVSAGLLLKYNDFSCLLPNGQTEATENLESLVGTTLCVAPIRVDYNRARLIVSEKVATAIKSRAEKEQFISTLEVGQTFEGTVKNIEKYGAFVELGSGVEGLLHISEVEHNRISDVSKVLSVGEKVNVKIIKLEEGHIGLSRKALIPNFWMEYVNDKNVGSVVNGTIIEINKSGLVLDLAENVTGFLPKSEFAWERDAFVEDFVTVGDSLELKIIELDPNKKRIILSKKQMAANPWDNLGCNVGDTVTVSVVAVLKDGVKLLYNGALGYASKNNLVNVDVDALEKGQTLELKVRAIDLEKTRIIFGNRPTREERAPKPEKENSYNKYMKSDKPSNTLGDLFGDKLKNFK